MTNKVINGLSYIIFSWAAFYLLVNFVFPPHWFIDYKSLVAEDVCRDTRQQIYGERWVPFKVKAGGVDQLYSVDKEMYVDRFEWDGTYFKGTTNTGWKVLVTSMPGTYEWHSNTLHVTLPGFIKVHIDDVKSNQFKVLECN